MIEEKGPTRLDQHRSSSPTWRQEVEARRKRMGLRSGSGRKQGLPPSKNVYRSKSAQSLAKNTLGQTQSAVLIVLNGEVEGRK